MYVTARSQQYSKGSSDGHVIWTLALQNNPSVELGGLKFTLCLDRVTPGERACYPDTLLDYSDSKVSAGPGGFYRPDEPEFAARWHCCQWFDKNTGRRYFLIDGGYIISLFGLPENFFCSSL
ncbi:hypothetical protein CEXT_276611 [Caerostris extrusa]|uniref:MATH domain-containing protein n=1 Tax=Caerostris extrusa TaxID=172846 RepID=A0AAV4XF88_CAEEX|nr:hypothetical protein CEXT_276611 [Caerostris extrusa]